MIQTLGRAKVWLARGGVAMAAATAVTVGVASMPANAVVIPPPPIIGGGVVTAGADAVVGGAVACAASVVCAVGVGAVVVGTAAYMTRDTWIPWIKGVLPGVGPSNLQGAPGAPAIMGDIVLQPDGKTLQFSLADIRTGTVFGDVAVYFDTTMVCHYGSGYSTNSESGKIVAVPKGGVAVVNMSCNLGAPVALITGQTPGRSAVQSPSNFSQWGGSDVDAAAGAVNYHVTVKCVLAGGGTQDISVDYSGVKGGFIMPACEAHGAGLGTHASGVTVGAQLPGQTGYKTVWGTQAVTSSNYPQCQINNYDGRCVLEVWVNGSPCQAGSSACVDWMRRVQREGATNYGCHWGPYTVPMTMCDVLERAYTSTGSDLSQDTNTDGNPDTSPDTGGSPGTGTGTGGFPGSVDVPATSPNGDTQGVNCYPTGTAVWNPVEWVLRPVQCALWWAFVPANTGEKIQDWWDVNKGRFDASVPGRWWAILPLWGGAFAGGHGGGGCQGPAVSTGFLGAHGWMPATIYPFEACSGVKATVAATSNMVLTVMIGWASAWRLARIVGKPFGYSLDLMKERG